MLLAHLVGNVWMVEQPCSSLLNEHCRFQWLLRVFTTWGILVAALKLRHAVRFVRGCGV